MTGTTGRDFGLIRGYATSAAVEPTIPFKTNFGSRILLALDFNLILRRSRRRSRLTLGLTFRMHSESTSCGSGWAAAPTACDATMSVGRILGGIWAAWRGSVGERIAPADCMPAVGFEV